MQFPVSYCHQGLLKNTELLKKLSSLPLIQFTITLDLIENFAVCKKKKNGNNLFFKMDQVQSRFVNNLNFKQALIRINKCTFLCFLFFRCYD